MSVHQKEIEPLFQHFDCLDAWQSEDKQTSSLRFPIEKLKNNKMLYLLGQAWQRGSALAA